MKFDPSDLKTLASQISAIFGTGGKAGTAGGGAVTAGGPAGGTSNPSFLSIFKPLAALDAIKAGISFIVKNSSVANSYLGVMGKMFGAAIDLLLIPFIPIFNLLLVGMGKLVEWLAKDEVQEFLSRLANGLVQKAEQLWAVVKDVYNILNGVIHGDLDKVWGSIKDLGGDLWKLLTNGSPLVLAVAAIATALAVAEAKHLLTVQKVFVVNQTGGKGGGGPLGLPTMNPWVAGIAAVTAAVVGGEQFLEKKGIIQKGQFNNGINNAIGTQLPILYDKDHMPQNQQRNSVGSVNTGAYGTIKPPNTGDGGLASSAPINQTITINVNGVQSPSEVAKLVGEEFRKLGRGLAAG